MSISLSLRDYYILKIFFMIICFLFSSYACSRSLWILGYRGQTKRFRTFCWAIAIVIAMIALIFYYFISALSV